MGRDAVPPNSLPGEINTATRSLHTTLNRLITARLPLGLPPHTTDSTLYTTGLLHFAHIFLTFESLWADILPSSSTASPPISPLLSYLLVNPYAEPSLFTSTNPPSTELLAFLQTLRPMGLARSSRLKKDLKYLMEVHPTDLDVVLAQYPGEKVADFCAHIRRSVQARPHVLVAYAWCFYMAVFSGGRWIRSELLKAGPEFWQASHVELQDEKTTGTAPKGLSFWHFPGSDDGEDIKSAFKARLETAETLFTAAERIDIIEEAKTIFELSATLVTELDEKLGTDMEKSKKLEQAERQQGEKSDVLIESRGTLERPQEQVHRVSLSDAVMWLRKPEVTGTVLAISCLACAALLRLQD